MTPEAQESSDGHQKANPVVWGSVRGQRISMSTYNGKVWLHVYGNAHVHKDQHRLSIGIFPDQVLRLIAHAHFLLPIAEEQNRAWREANGHAAARAEPNLNEAALTG